jgi:hypothetical protein
MLPQRRHHKPRFLLGYRGKKEIRKAGLLGRLNRLIDYAPDQCGRHLDAEITHQPRGNRAPKDAGEVGQGTERLRLGRSEEFGLAFHGIDVGFGSRLLTL